MNVAVNLPSLLHRVNCQLSAYKRSLSNCDVDVTETSQTQLLQYLEVFQQICVTFGLHSKLLGETYNTFCGILGEYEKTIVNNT